MDVSARSISLLEILADGHFHSGEAIGKALGISRAAIWKLVQQLSALDIEIHAVTGRGYRLAKGFEPLEEETVYAAIGKQAEASVSVIKIFKQTDSTNQQLLLDARNNLPGGAVYVAEMQTSGRGRRGRHWVSPYGRNIYFSLLWRFNEGTTRLGGLSLAVAVALLRAFDELGIRGAGVKWPNDILVDGKKLAGVLLDVAGEAHGPCHVVVGVGINYDMPSSYEESIDQPVTDLVRESVSVSRSTVLGKALQHLVTVIDDYEKHGLEPFLDEWREHDVALGQEVSIHRGNDVHACISRGIDASGLLLVEEGGELRRYPSGEVSLRGRFT